MQSQTARRVTTSSPAQVLHDLAGCAQPVARPGVIQRIEPLCPGRLHQAVVSSRAAREHHLSPQQLELVSAPRELGPPPLQLLLQLDQLEPVAAGAFLHLRLRRSGHLVRLRLGVRVRVRVRARFTVRVRVRVRVRVGVRIRVRVGVRG